MNENVIPDTDKVCVSVECVVLYVVLCCYCRVELMLLSRIRICLLVKKLFSRILRYMLYCSVSVDCQYVLCCRMDGRFLTRVRVCHLVIVLVLGRLRYMMCYFGGDVVYMLYCR